MHKIRCPHCGVINLEKFISYPQCAGCGSTLPQLPSSATVVPFWRRPVRPLFWALSVGLLLAILLWAASVFQVVTESQSQVVFYGDKRRSARVGQVISFNLRVDALGESRREHSKALQAIKLRIPLRAFDALRFLSISPPPDEMTIVGKGRYFGYEALPHDGNLSLRLRVAKAGQHTLPITVYADDHMPGFWRISVQASTK